MSRPALGAARADGGRGGRARRARPRSLLLARFLRRAAPRPAPLRALRAPRAVRGPLRPLERGRGPEPRVGAMRRFLLRVNFVLLLLAISVWTFYFTLPDVSALKTRTPATTAFIDARRAKLRQEGKD